MTAPVTQRFGFTSFYRQLACWSLLYLGAASTVALTIATILHGVAATRDAPLADLFAGLFGVLAFSVLLTVVTWYRDVRAGRDAACLGRAPAAPLLRAGNAQ